MSGGYKSYKANSALLGSLEELKSKEFLLNKLRTNVIPNLDPNKFIQG